jgi:hypothetical protein
MKKLKIPLIIALILLDIFIHLSAAQERLEPVSVSAGKWDDDRKMLAELDGERILAWRNNFVYNAHELENQIKELSKRYGDLITQKLKTDTLEASASIQAEIDSIEAHQKFIVSELAKLIEYIEELDYQLERNSPRA